MPPSSIDGVKPARRSGGSGSMSDGPQNQSGYSQQDIDDDISYLDPDQQPDPGQQADVDELERMNSLPSEEDETDDSGTSEFRQNAEDKIKEQVRKRFKKDEEPDQGPPGEGGAEGAGEGAEAGVEGAEAGAEGIEAGAEGLEAAEAAGEAAEAAEAVAEAAELAEIAEAAEAAEGAEVAAAAGSGGTVVIIVVVVLILLAPLVCLYVIIGYFFSEKSLWNKVWIFVPFPKLFKILAFAITLIEAIIIAIVIGSTLYSLCSGFSGFAVSVYNKATGNFPYCAAIGK